MKKIVGAVILALVVIVCGVTLFLNLSHKNNGSQASNTQETSGSNTTDSSKLKVGVILPGDETDSYSHSQIVGIKKMAEELNIPEKDIIWKIKVKNNDDYKSAVSDLSSKGCSYVVVTNDRLENAVIDNATEYENMNFVFVGGTSAKISKLKNVYDVALREYEARYVSGVVAGLKIKELAEANALQPESLDNDNNVRIGYVGSFKDAKTISGYTAFFLGAKSVYPQITMELQYVDGKNKIDAEATSAQLLMSRGSVIVAYDTDSHSIPAMVQMQKDGGKPAFCISSDENLSEDAKTAQLAAVEDQWSVVYKDIFSKVLNGEKLDRDKSYGYAEGALLVSDFSEEAAPNTKETVDSLEQQFKEGTIKVFDTSKFTVGGKALSKATIDLSYYKSDDEEEALFKGESKNAIVSENGITYFAESKFRAAPYFNYVVDGVVELEVSEPNPKE